MSKLIHVVFALFALLLYGLSVRSSGLTRIGNSKYYVSSSEATYVEANMACQMEDNMQLAGFEIEEEYLQFNETMNNWGIPAEKWPLVLECQLDYSTWSNGEPYCSATLVCCLLMGKSATEARNWQAFNCCTEHLYICEV